MKIELLIEQMQETKALHPTLDINDILSMFLIASLNDLTRTIRNGR